MRGVIFDFSDTLQSEDGAEVIPATFLRKLKAQGIVLCIFTNAHRSELFNYLADKNGLFNMIVTREDVSNGKPSPEGIHRIKQNFPNLDFIYIGDSSNDELAAGAAGIKFFLTQDYSSLHW